MADNNNGWILIKTGSQFSNFSNYQEWQLNDASCINNPPIEAQKSAPGSKAYLGDYSKIWNKTNAGTWVDVINSGLIDGGE